MNGPAVTLLFFGDDYSQHAAVWKPKTQHHIGSKTSTVPEVGFSIKICLALQLLNSVFMVNSEIVETISGMTETSTVTPSLMMVFRHTLILHFGWRFERGGFSGYYLLWRCLIVRLLSHPIFTKIKWQKNNPLQSFTAGKYLMQLDCGCFCAPLGFL